MMIILSEEDMEKIRKDGHLAIMLEKNGFCACVMSAEYLTDMEQKEGERTGRPVRARARIKEVLDFFLENLLTLGKLGYIIINVKRVEKPKENKINKEN